VLKIVIGLPGSGKTALLEKMRGQGFRIFDDFRAGEDAPFVEMSQNFGPLMDELLAGKDCAVSDIAFCEPEFRSEFFKSIQTRLPRQGIEWIYFENAPEKCRNNLKRENGAHLEHDLRDLEQFSTRYTIPAGTSALPVTSPED
jgi:hypothetical protein